MKEIFLTYIHPDDKELIDFLTEKGLMDEEIIFGHVFWRLLYGISILIFIRLHLYIIKTIKKKTKRSQNGWRK